MEDKIWKVVMDGTDIKATLDTNKDGQPSATLILHGAEGIEEVLNGITGLFSKAK